MIKLMPYSNPEKQKQALHAHYEKNKEAYTARARIALPKIKEARKAWLIALKEKKPCADCGVRYPSRVMDYHHTKNKEYNIARMVNGGWSEKRILVEIEKCVLLCANCHRLRHAN